MRRRFVEPRVPWFVWSISILSNKNVDIVSLLWLRTTTQNTQSHTRQRHATVKSPPAGLFQGNTLHEKNNTSLQTELKRENINQFVLRFRFRNVRETLPQRITSTECVCVCVSGGRSRKYITSRAQSSCFSLPP